MQSVGRRSAIAFDVDGTIIDSLGLHLEAWMTAFEGAGHPVDPEKLQTQFGRRADYFVREFMPDADDRTIEEIVEGKRCLYRARIGEIKLFPGARELLERLRELGISVGLATSASRRELDSYVAAFELAPLIDADISGDEIARSKPDPEILLKIFAELGADILNSVYVGDSPHDMGSAKASGARGIGVLTGGYSRSSLEREGAVVVFNSVMEIPVEMLTALGRD